MKLCKSVLAGLALAASISNAQAVAFHFDGNIANHNDVVRIPIVFDADAANVRVWTDSVQEDYINFDPTIALWKKGETDWTLFRAAEDEPTTGPGQAFMYDDGVFISSITAGNYLLTIAANPNRANGNLLSQGFRFDNEEPIALANWSLPYTLSQMGTYWSVHLDDAPYSYWGASLEDASDFVYIDASGASDDYWRRFEDDTPYFAVSPVPEPEAYALMLTGLGMMGFIARRRKTAAKI